LMRVRGNTIYYESFAIALSQADLTAQQSSPAWPADVDISNMDAVLERIDWSGMRSKLSTSLAAGDALIPRIRQNPAAPAQLDGKTIAVLFVAHCSGNLKFYCPQASAARLAMNDQQFAAEKAKLMGRCERGGRPGGPADVDEYGGDNKRVRERNDRFNWSFTQH
jgi:hypothetical protein